MIESVGESARLVYERLTASHAVGLSAALLDPRVYAHIPAHFAKSVEDLEVEFTRHASGPSDVGSGEIWWNYAVRLRSGGFIGRVEATIHHGLAEVAYMLGPSYWGNGYATEALHWLHARLLECRQVNSFWAAVRPENDRSIRLLERLRYDEVLQDWPKLYSYDAGDRVYSREPTA